MHPSEIAATAALPAGWEEREHEGTVFYKNVETGEKSWVHPSEIAATETLPAGWEEREHEGAVFYKNVETGEKSWVHPTDATAVAVVGGALQADDDVLPSGWEACESEEGHTFFKNIETGAKQWTHPTLPSELDLPAGWEIREHGGKTFYKNVETSEKTWVHPTAAAAAAAASPARDSCAEHGDADAPPPMATPLTTTGASRRSLLAPRAPTYVPNHTREGAARGL